MDGRALRSLIGVAGLRDGKGGFPCRMMAMCQIGKLTHAQTTGNSSSYVGLQDASGCDRR